MREFVSKLTLTLRQNESWRDVEEKEIRSTVKQIERSVAATLFNWFDSTKAKAELGFKPGHSSLAIENSVRWMKDNGLLN